MTKGNTMAVTPLTNRPVPQNSNESRAMFVWVGATAALDPLDTDADQQALLNFCGTNGVNVLFLDIWRYLGGANWTNAKRDRLKLFNDAAHRSGIKVHALCGDLGWGTLQQWVMKNIMNPIMAYNAMCTKTSEQFDGICLDVEYWQDEVAYPAATHLPGLCDLIKAMRQQADGSLSVGCFAGFFLKDNSGARALLTYNGKLAQDGEHLMDVCDFVIPGTYRDHAADNGTDGVGQITLFQPWYDYASTEGKNFGLYCGSETINITPTYITYFGGTKAAMEAEHTLVSNAFKVETNSVFLGQAIHSYDGWKAMS